MKEHSIAPWITGEARLVTARSHLIDRIVPDCEVIVLPEKTVAGGVLAYGRDALPNAPDTRGRLERLRYRRGHRPITEPVVMDLRRNSPDNWAHFLNNHLPILFHITGEMGLAPSQVLAVTPRKTPGYIQASAALFGIRTIQTDDILDGQGIVFDAQPWTGIRPARADWVRQCPAVQDVLKKIDAKAATGPARVFLSRRKTRTLENEAEVADWLGARGFVTVYPEDLNAADQIRLFRQAEVMVAIHGAGLAPLLYCQPGGRLRHLVEILPCGHMTDVYRVIAGQVGCSWIGVRGRLKPHYVKSIYDFETPFLAFSLDSFSVDMHALEKAFALAGVAE